MFDLQIEATRTAPLSPKILVLKSVVRGLCLERGMPIYSYIGHDSTGRSVMVSFLLSFAYSKRICWVNKRYGLFSVISKALSMYCCAFPLFARYALKNPL